MKHTDLYSEYKKLDEIAASELIAAVKAHGKEYVFVTFNDDGITSNEDFSNIPIVAASTKWMDEYQDFYVSRVEVEGNHYILYGWPKEDYCIEEHEIESVAHGHLEYIIDYIPETETVKDVSSFAFVSQPTLNQNDHRQIN